jgi:hypothetical protein
VVFFNEFWLKVEDWTRVNATVSSLPLKLYFNTKSLMMWQLAVQMKTSWKMQEEMGASAEGESDELIRMMTDTNPWLLGLTVAVSLLHMVFDFLAFKNDISFWRSRKSMAGLSVRTIFINTFFQFIITLYLLDNDTSLMIVMSNCIGLAIEVWKIKKAVNMSVEWREWHGHRLPRITWTDRDSYTKSNTKQFDDTAVEHLMYFVWPLVVGYCGYTLMYSEHKGWYSWILSSVVSFIYAFGFILMTPQLFINYKLKSVAHLPWRAMVYKSLNTFVDDLFAFIIKMPWLHRLSCFRDDIIFFIYLYQRWIYRVDRTRRNEFGTTGEEIDGLVIKGQLGDHAAAGAAAAGHADQGWADVDEDVGASTAAPRALRSKKEVCAAGPAAPASASAGSS